MIKGLLIDLDGVVYNDTEPIPRVKEALQWIEKQGIPYRFITNTTMKSRISLQRKLEGFGITIPMEYIFSALYAAALYVNQKKHPRCYLMLTEDAKLEFGGLDTSGDVVDYVIAGDLGTDISFDILNEAFQKLYNGAELIALQKNRFWLSNRGITLDAGAFIALLEFAADVKAKVIGKPSAAFFKMAVQDIYIEPPSILMIGDDVESDIAGASAQGIKTCLVKTGKFRDEDLRGSDIKPDFILPSLADLPQSRIL